MMGFVCRKIVIGFGIGGLTVGMLGRRGWVGFGRVRGWAGWRSRWRMWIGDVRVFGRCTCIGYLCSIVATMPSSISGTATCQSPSPYLSYPPS